MLFKPSTLLFLATLTCGTFMCVSSPTWMGAWMGLEINMLSFIPLITEQSNQRATESSLKYFIVQVLGSVIIITTALLTIHTMSNTYAWVLKSPLILAILLKMGAAPTHFWFPGVMEGMSWNNCMILMTWQKLAPLMLLSYMNSSLLTSLSAISSSLIGGIGGLNQSLLRKLMGYSSIGHMGWMIASMESSESFWLTYIVVYSILSITVANSFKKTQSFHIAQFYQTLNSNIPQKYIMSTNLLSLGGLPPFLGFLPKWMAISIVMTNSPITAIMLIIGALINLYYYLRITFTAFITTHFNQKWTTNIMTSINLTTESMMAIVSITGMLMIPVIWPS
uniref:NADH-ubiquinone oxidoreductase chain 2 n=1 Tax=Japyx solifugus TaxID=296598 RepID=Q4G305_JAPSO|nr:NADH dehydrogenase subunit 2 [Japyx solifugus]AAV33411.1 NADH dehydrogenase subunit 2 [Japyx solifugus]